MHGRIHLSIWMLTILTNPATATAQAQQDLAVPQQLIFEDRPTASQVNNILLPYLIAQQGHPESGFELPSTDVWWAWRAQYNLAIERPITDVMHLAAHNSYNSLGDGYEIFPAFAPNQILSVTRLLELGSRLIEIDIHDTGSGFLEVFHAIDSAGARDLVDVLSDISTWLDANPSEIVFVDIEDASEVPEGDTVDSSVDLALRTFFGDPDEGPGASLILTPPMRAALGRWPSRQEMLALGARVIVLTHRNDSGDGRFGTPTLYTDTNGHQWYGAGLAFRANGGEDPISDRGNFRQFKVQDIQNEIVADPSLLANTDFFLSMQSDGIDQIPPSLFDLLLGFVPQLVDLFTQFDAKRATPSDARTASRHNVNFLKMDFLFGHDEDAGLGSNLAHFYGIPYVRDDAYEIENDGSRVKRLRFAIWSWSEDDPAVQRQIFQDVVPGDGSGDLQRDWIMDMTTQLGKPGFFDALEAAGIAARGNDRDFAVQRSVSGAADRRWRSVTELGTETLADPAESYPFALRSTDRDPATGRYRWKLSATRGPAANAGLIPPSELVDGDGFEYVFAGPVNGLQNEGLFLARAIAGDNTPVWLNVNDADRDGQWTACPCVTTIGPVVVMEPVIDEAGTGRLSLLFNDRDAFDTHTVTVDWGDGSSPDVVALTGGERAFDATHVYDDDDPSGTASDSYTISIEIDDGVTLPATATASITVRNVAPVVSSFSSSSPAIDPTPSGEPVTVLAAFSDVGTADSHGATVAWGDDAVTAALVIGSGGSGTATADHSYSTGGVFEVVVTVTDDDTGAVTAGTSAFVTGVGLRDGVLQVVGTPGRDVITVHQVDGQYARVHAGFLEGGYQDFDLSLVERVEIWVCGEEDQINVAGNVRDIEVVVLDCADL